MYILRTIVVAVDFTEGSRIALIEAIRTARLNDAKVHAVHIIDTLVASELEEAMAPFQANVHESLLADATQAWASFTKGIDGAANVPLHVRIDHRVRGIVTASNELHANLLIVGAFSARAPQVGQGTVATSCVRHASSNVLLVRDTQSGPFTIVVACVDFSPTSRLALQEAARVAKQDGAALHILHVFGAPWRELHYRAPTPQAQPHFQRQYREGLERRLKAFAQETSESITTLSPTFSVFDDTGHRPGIIEYAAKVDADLIVLGTSGKTAIRNILMGTTAEKTLRESSCSVLAVKPEGFTIPLSHDDNPPHSQMRVQL